jgi:hypothetical protein
MGPDTGPDVEPDLQPDPGPDAQPGATGTRTVRGPGWTVLLPSSWTTLPTDPAAARPAIKRLLDRSFEGKPRDELAQHRIKLDQMLRRQCAAAGEMGARHVHALSEPVRGLPVTATLIGVPLDLPPEHDLLDALTEVLGAAEGVVESEETEVSGMFALRRVRRRPTRLDDDPTSPEVMSTHVEYVVALPDETLLVLAFTTTTEPVHRELVVLFDAITTTLQVL